ncbi:MAG: hypothetical protein R3F55_14865 [Alphaproteobacteria bacterium]
MHLHTAAIAFALALLPISPAAAEQFHPTYGDCGLRVVDEATVFVNCAGADVDGPLTEQRLAEWVAFWQAQMQREHEMTMDILRGESGGTGWCEVYDVDGAYLGQQPC